MLKKIAVAVFLGMLVSSYCYAGTLIGARSCEDWSKFRAKKDVSVLFVQIWLSGFMSGLSEASTSESDPLKNVKSPEEIFSWMDGYCSKYKDSDIGTGGEVFKLEAYARNIKSLP